jgi:hypothetical protein
MLEAFLSSTDHLIAVESFWDRGGLPLRKLTNPIVRGFYGSYPLPLKGAVARFIEFEETNEVVSLWFGGGKNLKDIRLSPPLSFDKGWKLRPGVRARYEDEALGITLWLAGLRRVAGIAFRKEVLETRLPIQELEVHYTDFK